MRVTHVITRLIVGGAQENTVATVRGLQENFGCDVQLISGPSLGPEGSLEGEVPPGMLHRLPHLVRPVHPLQDALALRRLTDLFGAQRPDIVHTHSGKAGIIGRLAAARAGVPAIIHTIHGPSFGPFQGPLANAVFRAAEKAAARHTTHFISVAEAMTRQYLAAGIGHPGKYTRIWSGFPLEPFLQARNDPALRRHLGLQPHHLVIGKIGRLFELKGHDDVFAIAPDLIATHPQVRFLFVGDGPWRERFQRRAAQLGLADHFIFTGLVPPAEMARYVGIMDLLVHLSRREGLPRALPQALAAAKAVLAYDCDGAGEVCRQGETGYLIAPGDLQSLKERLNQLIGNAQLREQLGRRGQAFVRQEFALEKMVAAIYELYVRLLRPQAK